MFNFLKKQSQPKGVTVMERPRSNNQIIEEIHETFFTEVDKLLEEAKISHSLDTDKQRLIDKCERLQKLGFTQTKEVKEAKSEILRLENLKRDNERKAVLIEAINYFSTKYPHYKFITEESVKKICEKYKLVYGEISLYIGTVPDKNLSHIEEFKIDEKDTCWRKSDMYGEKIIYGSKSRIYCGQEVEDSEESYMRLMIGSGRVYIRSAQASLEICAPQRDFQMSRHEVKDRKIVAAVPPDPIVLCPVVFKEEKYYLIVTAWGDEASDESVVNERNN